VLHRQLAKAAERMESSIWTTLRFMGLSSYHSDFLVAATTVAAALLSKGYQHHRPPHVFTKDLCLAPTIMPPRHTNSTCHRHTRFEKTLTITTIHSKTTTYLDSQ